MNLAPLLKEIGRGRDGSRALDRASAAQLMREIAAGHVDDLGLGAVLLALRMKGEAVSEVAGFLDGLAGLDMPPVAAAPGGRPWLVVPSYNGARKLTNLLPLLLLLLAREGVPVLVHGQPSEPQAGRLRVGSLAILAALGHAPLSRPEQAAAQAADGRLAVLPLAVLSPTLSRLVALRERLGVRNVAHTLVKLVRPVAGPNLLLTSITHPEFAQLYGELFALTGEAAICLRGTEGESVVRPQRAQPLQWWADGASREIPMPQEGPETMPGPQFEATLAYTRAVLDGALAAPPSLLAQRDAILAAWHAPGG